MKTVCKKLLSLMLVAVLLVSAVPFQASAAEVVTEPVETTAVTETTAATEATEAPAETAAAAETTAATEASTEATEAPVETNETTETAPSIDDQAKAVGDTISVRFTLKDYPQANIYTATNVQIGYKVPLAPTEAQILTAYAQYAGSYTGKKFSHWEVNGKTFDPYNTNITDTIATAGVQLVIEAVVTDAQQSVYLNPNYGAIAGNNYYHPVLIGQIYNHLATLPTPTRTHYTFLYWNKVALDGTKTKVNGNDIVSNLNPLMAEWALNKYTVSFQRHDGTQWVGVKDVQVDALGTLTTLNGFPTDTEINNSFKLSGFKIVGWEIGETDKEFTPGLTMVDKNIVVRPRYQREITLLANNPAGYTSNSTKSITVEIGEPIPALPNPGARDGWTFHRWIAYSAAGEIREVANKSTLTNVSIHGLYDPYKYGDTFHAEWSESTVVYLYIHTNGNTQTATKIVPYYEAPTHGAFDTKLINMYSIFADYGKYDDLGDAAYGWYDATQWKNYCANTAANAATTFYDIKDNGYIELHIMLIDNGNNTSSNVNNNNYNNNSSTADPSNPTTGDMIFMAVTVMAVSAAALILLFALKKRKASK